MALVQSTVVVERPPEGPAQGRWGVPAWTIVALVVAALILSLGLWLWRVRQLRKKAT